MNEDIHSSLLLNSYEEISQNEGLSLFFNPNLESMDVESGLYPNNVLNFFTEKDNYNNKNLNDSIKIENFKDFYKIADEMSEENEIKSNNIINDKNEKIINDKNNFSKYKNIKSSLETYFFPFTPRKGINISKLSDEAKIVIQNDEIKCNELDSEKSSKENSTNSELIINNKNNIYDIQFMTKKYNIMPDGKKRKIKKMRKFKSDDIRKKIKSRFHKTLKDLINERLKKAGSIKLFDFIPHYFINNVTRKINSKFLDLTYKDLLSYNFINEEYKEKSLNKEVDYKKFLINQEVLKYLEQHENISKTSGFDIIKNKKYKDLLNIYFSSLEFENSITRLKNENENNDYIQEYIFTAKHFVEFFSNNNGDENEIIKNNDNI